MLYSVERPKMHMGISSVAKVGVAWEGRQRDVCSSLTTGSRFWLSGDQRRWGFLGTHWHPIVPNRSLGGKAKYLEETCRFVFLTLFGQIHFFELFYQTSGASSAAKIRSWWHNVDQASIATSSWMAPAKSQVVAARLIKQSLAGWNPKTRAKSDDRLRL
jgi:hypothetical protein